MTDKTIELQKMTENGFSKYLKAQIENYARVRARAFKNTFREELAVARRQVAGLLKNGLKTKGHFIYDAVDTKTSETVGNLWIHVEQNKKRAFLYDIIVHERFWRLGYGRAMLDSLDTTMRRMHVRIIRLHVFAENEVAFNLYKRQGYRVVSYNMHKEL